MNRKWLMTLLLSLSVTLVACSDNATSEKPSAEKEHFLTEKMEAIKKAEKIEKTIRDAAVLQRRNIEEQGG